MKLTIEQPALVTALSSAIGVIENRNTIPILGNILIDASDAGLRITASNLDMWHAETVVADVAAPGATTIPAKLALDFVRKLPSGAAVTIESKDDTQIVIKSGRSRATLSTLPAEDFPAVETFQSNSAFSVPADKLASVIRKLTYAISTEETRYYLNGIHVRPIDGKRLDFVATNGHILARHAVAVEDDVEGLSGIIIPRAAIDHIGKLIAKATGPVEVQSTDRNISFRIGGIHVTSKLIDGTFPDYQRVIPTDVPHDAHVDRLSLDAAVARISSIVKSGKGARGVRFDFVGDGIKISARSNETNADGEDFIDAEYTGPDITVGYNCLYIDQVAGAFDGDTLRVSLNADSGFPGVFTSPTEPDYLAVVMPMRVA